MFKYPIAISLSPNTEKEDVWQALKIIFQPWYWKKGRVLIEVESWFKDYFERGNVYLFSSGRSAFYAILKAFDIGRGDEVLIQPFTCVAVPDPIIWAGARPVFVDIDETLNINPGALEKHINNKTRVIVVQHTFGIPAKIHLIKEIAQKHNLILIEDCAHSLGATHRGQKIGTFGDACFFSFGRDKVISSVFGGAAIINSKFKIQNSKLNKIYKKLEYPGYFWVFQQLLHPVAFFIILPLYNIIIGKLILFILQKLNLLSKPVYCGETKGEKPDIFPSRYPNGLANLLSIQLKKLDRYNQRRRNIAVFYFDKLRSVSDIKLPVKVDGAIYLRFNIFTKKDIFKRAKKRGILLGNWYREVIDPGGVDFEKIGYKERLCPKAEKMARLSVNLPTYPRLTMADLKEVVGLLTGSSIANDTGS